MHVFVLYVVSSLRLNASPVQVLFGPGPGRYSQSHPETFFVRREFLSTCFDVCGFGPTTPLLRYLLFFLIVSRIFRDVRLPLDAKVTPLHTRRSCRQLDTFLEGAAMLDADYLRVSNRGCNKPTGVACDQLPTGANRRLTCPAAQSLTIRPHPTPTQGPALA